MITSTDTKIIYDGDGSTTAFPYTFGIIDASNIQVVRIDSDGSEHLLDADYYVDVANGNVNYPGYAPGSAPPVEEQPPVLPVNSKLCIYRSVPQTQITDLPSTYPLSVIEASLDKLTMLLQEVSETTGRSLKLSIGNGAGIDMVLPVEAGKTFKWATDGKSLVLTDDPAVVYEATVTLYAAVQAAVTDALGYKNAALALAMDAAAYRGNALSYKNAAQSSAEAAAASASQAEQWAAVIDPDAYEPTLGSPDVDGKVLSSTTAGERSWIFPTADLSNYYTKTQTDALIPTTLPASDVSAWAKDANKPSYTYSEVGAAAASHGHTVSQISDFPASMPANGGTATTANNIPTSDVGGNIWIA